MEFTKHPHLDLLVNEDGSVMMYEGKPLTINFYEQKNRNFPRKMVHVANRTTNVSKLVCEAWNGMRDTPEQTVHAKDKNPSNTHYTNLYWDIRGKVQTARTKRAKSSKVKKNEIPEVIKRIESGETLNNIGKSYNTTGMSIGRIKRRFMADRLMMLKEAVMHAKTAHERQQAYAKYMGYKTVTDAIGQLGKHKFYKATDSIAVTL